MDWKPSTIPILFSPAGKNIPKKKERKKSEPVNHVTYAVVVGPSKCDPESVARKGSFLLKESPEREKKQRIPT